MESKMLERIKTPAIANTIRSIFIAEKVNG